MHEIAMTVAAWLRSGTEVNLAWAVETHGFSSRDRAEVWALTPDGGGLGAVLAGSLDDQLRRLSERGVTRRLLDLHVGDAEAAQAGLSCGGDARCLLLPAGDVPSEFWARLLAREPVCLVTQLSGDQVTGYTVFTRQTIDQATPEVARLFGRATTDVLVTPELVATAWWPVPQLVVVGGGAIAEALAAAATPLGWPTHIATEVDVATAAIARLAVVDNVVVLSHDNELAGPALAAALDGGVGYLGALGSRRTQQSRADWLAEHGCTDTARIHGPAGLDIGAGTPAEIAIAILAEALAVKSGTSAGSLRDRSGSIH